ncbi:hypothetical protein [Cognatilysobacter terrigena]|uniref:hypothetical protein n=1 Tax=Cognatilysobacter terrigena TaxID=2488749 RepID=UPI0010611A8D|nr:hypothetical protein [Lysobacter terrigena]
MALTRWVAPAVLAATLGVASLTPAPAKAQSMNDLTQAIVNIADVVFQGNQPYYRYGDYSADDRLVMRRDQYGRPVYYRVVNNGYNAYNGYNTQYRTSPPYGRAYGYYNQSQGQQRMKCNKNGKCKVEYYDARYDRRGYGYDDRRWRGRDD